MGADLEALTKEAAAIAVARIFRELQEAAPPASAGQPALDRLQGGPLSSQELQCVLDLCSMLCLQ